MAAYELCGSVERLKHIHTIGSKGLAIAKPLYPIGIGDHCPTDCDHVVLAAFKAAQDAVTEQNKSSALAISKSEFATAESIKQLQAIFQTAIGAINDKIDDMKSRMDKGEGRSKGLGDGWGYLVGAVGIGWGIAATIELITKHNN